MNEHKPPKYHFFVDGNKYETDNTALTGLEIKTTASVPANYQLYLEGKGNDPDSAVSDGESMHMEPPPKHFYAVPPATFGNHD